MLLMLLLLMFSLRAYLVPRLTFDNASTYQDLVACLVPGAVI
jgi:hypothetical protein